MSPPRLANDAAPTTSTRGHRFSTAANGPSKRALLGGLLVAVAFVAAFAVTRPQDVPPPPDWVIVTRDVGPGERLEAADLALAPAALDPAQASAAFPAIEEVAGAGVLGPLRAGELLQRGSIRVDGTGSTTHDVALALPVERALAGRLQLGERVDVLTTAGSGPTAETEVAAPEALVLTIDQPTDDMGPAATVTVTLGLRSAEESLAVVHGAATGVVTLTRPPAGAAGTS